MPYLVAHVASSCVLQAAGGSDDSLVLVLHIELHFEEQHPCGSPLLRSPNSPTSQFTTQCSSQASPQTLSPITVRHATLYCGSCTCIKCVRECLPIRTLTACSPARSAARLPAHLCMCLHIRASTHTHTHAHMQRSPMLTPTARSPSTLSPLRSSATRSPGRDQVRTLLDAVKHISDIDEMSSARRAEWDKARRQRADGAGQATSRH